ncbi:MAG TPA: universal stress protein [Steroidobacteraceae bacterium]
MEKLTSILTVIDPRDETRHVLIKAIGLARHFRAKVELFLCDSEQAYALRHAYDRRGIEQARQACLDESHRYLESLRRQLAAEDVEITTDASCESPLYQGIVQKVLRSRPDLVVKGAAGQHPLRRFTLDENDWQLARTCPVPLMLTRGRPWRACPTFAAAVDVSEHETEGFARTILQTAGYLAQGCNAALEVLYSERCPEDEPACKERLDRLHQLVDEFKVKEGRVLTLQGDPDRTLPEVAAKRNYDVLVLGALTHRPGLAALVGTLTSRLVDALDCDFVLVKPSVYVCPLEQRLAPRDFRLNHAT